MLTRVLFALVLICGAAATAVVAEESKIVALGLADRVVTEAELETSVTPPAPRFNSAGIAYVLAANLKKGDVVEIALHGAKGPLMRNEETLGEDQAKFLLQAGKRGVPAGGWPEGTYHAAAKIIRDGKVLIEQQSEPIPFE